MSRRAAKAAAATAERGLASRSARRLVPGLALVLALAGGLQAATRWVADAAHSTLEFTATQAGARFDGTFANFRPQIVFDPGDLAASRFVVEIDTASARTGDRERDEALAGADFFDSTRWPQSRFETTRIVANADGSFTATGRLTIRDRTHEVPVIVRYEPGRGGASARLSGSTRIRRLEFGVGDGEWRDTQWVGDEVEVRFALQLTRP